MDSCSFILFIIIVLINFLILNYVVKLEKIACDCSDNWKRDYIKYYAIVTLVLTLIITLIPVINSILNKKKSNIRNILATPFVRAVSILYSTAGLVNVYSLFTYSQNIVLSNCECSKSWERTFIYYYSMVIMSLYIFVLAVLLITSLCYTDVYQLKKGIERLNNKK